MRSAWLSASGPSAGVIGAVVASRIGRRIGLGPAYALGCFVFPASLLLVPLAGAGHVDAASSSPCILLSEFGAGLGVMILDINIGSINNARIGDRIRARANGAFRTINYGVRPIGALLGGLLGTAIGIREALFVVSIAASLRDPVDGRLADPRPARPARRRRVAPRPAYSQRNVRTASTTATTPQIASTSSDVARSV